VCALRDVGVQGAGPSECVWCKWQSRKQGNEARARQPPLTSVGHLAAGPSFVFPPARAEIPSVHRCASVQRHYWCSPRWWVLCPRPPHVFAVGPLSHRPLPPVPPPPPHVIAVGPPSHRPLPPVLPPPPHPCFPPACSPVWLRSMLSPVTGTFASQGPSPARAPALPTASCKLRRPRARATTTTPRPWVRWCACVVLAAGDGCRWPGPCLSGCPVT
jgi:hypothetical protein